MTDAFAVERTFDSVAEEWGRLDVLVNNAGALREASLEELTDEDFQETLDVNLRAAMVCARAAVPHMLRAGRGRILSAASVSTRLGAEGLTAYAAAKAALINFTKSLANAYSKDGILSNCIVPGLVRTEAVLEAARASAAATGKTVDEVLAETLRRRPIPAGRLGEPEDVAALVAFLASPRASWITGSTFTIDGGIVPTAP